jgi:hypothetical protein
MDDFEKMVVTTALKRMFESDYFSICTIDKCVKVIGCVPDKRDYDALSALHCVHWDAMTPDLRNMVLLKTVQMLDSPAMNLHVLDGMFKNAERLLN